MSIRQALMPWVSAALTSEARLHRRRRLQETRRRLLGRPHQATCYLRLDDPWSWLLAQTLPTFADHFGLQLKPVTMLWLDATMYPQPDMLAHLARIDAARLARFHGMTFPAAANPPTEEAVLRASRQLIAAEGSDEYWPLFNQLAASLWQPGQPSTPSSLPISSEQAWQLLVQRRENFLTEGHYLTATVHYAGEWYWGVDRLDHLAARLTALTGIDSGSLPDYGAAKYLSVTPGETDQKRKLELFFSFRSPYSWLALGRTFQLVDRHRMQLVIRPVLPMVMRGLSVPRAKRMYILQDAAREARLHEVPFGKICDPLGAGVENCMAVWPLAEQQGKLRSWLETAAQHIWSRGSNTANPGTIVRLAEEAGLNTSKLRDALNRPDWRLEAEENRAAMMAAGSWGVPTFRLNDEMTIWGQDRLGLLEKLLLQPPEQDRGRASK